MVRGPFVQEVPNSGTNAHARRARSRASTCRRFRHALPRGEECVPFTANVAGIAGEQSPSQSARLRMDEVVLATSSQDNAVHVWCVTAGCAPCHRRSA